MPRTVIRRADIMRRVGCGSSAMHDALAEGLLPKLFKVLGGRASGCFEDELDEILEARAAGATNNDIKAIVSRQVERRKARFAESRAA